MSPPDTEELESDDDELFLKGLMNKEISPLDTDKGEQENDSPSIPGNQLTSLTINESNTDSNSNNDEKPL